MVSNEMRPFNDKIELDLDKTLSPLSKVLQRHKVSAEVKFEIEVNFTKIEEMPIPDAAKEELRKNRTKEVFLCVYDPKTGAIRCR